MADVPGGVARPRREAGAPAEPRVRGVCAPTSTRWIISPTITRAAASPLLVSAKGSRASDESCGGAVEVCARAIGLHSSSADFLPRRRFARESRCERPEARARAVFTLPATHTTTRYGSSESAATRPSGPSHQGHRKWACSRGPVLLAVGSLRWPAAQQERRQSKVTGAGTCAPGLPTHYVTSEARNA